MSDEGYMDGIMQAIDKVVKKKIANILQISPEAIKNIKNIKEKASNIINNASELRDLALKVTKDNNTFCWDDLPEDFKEKANKVERELAGEAFHIMLLADYVLNAADAWEEEADDD